MAVTSSFNGFPKQCVEFYVELVQNNDKRWFAEHKSDYEKYVMAPARDFVFEMGKRLHDLSPKVVADPRMDRSIFRPYRDTRFSKDKIPYKTHLGIFMWEGNRAKMDCSGYYFHLEPPELLLACGNHCLSKPLLAEYRDSVVHAKHGPQLVKAIKAVESKGDYSVGGLHYKKVPRGYDPGHPNAALLLYNGLYSLFTTPIPEKLYSRQIIDYCFERFKDLSPIHKWLVEMTERAGT